jgi:hypothetical protein
MFFFPFFPDGQGASKAQEPSNAAPLPFLSWFGSAFEKASAPRPSADLGDFSVGFIRQTISAFTSSLTALGNSANALFRQVAAALAFDRIARDTLAFIEAAWAGFGIPRGGPASFGFAGFPQGGQDPMSFSPLLSQFSKPWANGNPWGALTEGFNFWTKLWAPAQTNPFFGGSSRTPSPLSAKVSVPGGFSWGFGWGA